MRDTARDRLQGSRSAQKLVVLPSGLDEMRVGRHTRSRGRNALRAGGRSIVVQRGAICADERLQDDGRKRRQTNRP